MTAGLPFLTLGKLKNASAGCRRHLFIARHIRNQLPARFLCGQDAAPRLLRSSASLKETLRRSR
jgi:hypothetical protein